MAKFVVALTAVSKSKDAETIARHLVKRRLAACINIIPGVVSHYVWKKKYCRDRELILMIKTLQSKVKLLETELLKIHPYQVAEFVVLPIQSGAKKYLEWVAGRSLKD